ncbi:MAG: SDR family NAD(P)-dependent oxidoreductase, partial [Bacteroidota bacterium]
MDLGIKTQRFIVSGATSGFGRAIAEALVLEGARVLIVGRRQELAEAFQTAYPETVKVVVGDITQEETMNEVLRQLGEDQLAGVVINAGGPPAKSSLETEIKDWDAAYRGLLRWKVLFTQKLLPRLLQQEYGRLLFLESISVKQPIENLVLSNS